MKNKILVIIIFIILLLVGGLGYYTYFIWESPEELNNVVKFTYSESSYEYLLKSESKEVGDLTAYDLVLSTISDVSFENHNISTIEKPLEDSKNVSYPDYEAETENRVCDEAALYEPDTVGELKIVWQKLGFTVEDIEKMDESLWPCSLTVNGGVENYTIVDGDEIRNEIISMFGTDNDVFDESFVFYITEDYNYGCGIYEYIYDKNVDKIIYFPLTGCGIGDFDKSYIVSQYEEDEEYKIEIVDVRFKGYYFDDFPSEIKIYNHNEYVNNNESLPILNVIINSGDEEYKIESEIIKNKKLFDNYTLTYKKVGDTYQFLSLEYID